LGDITGNLGYVMAMLPDILLGAFTGKTQSLRFGDNLLPIASIVAGLFVRNPLLKMLLVGLGGANLMNKAGHEALGRPMSSSARHTENQYRCYPDEPLNPRIVNPVLQGSTLIATIDRVPCTIQLTPVVAEAYRAGALPLNTLACLPRATSCVISLRRIMTTGSGKQSCVHEASNKSMNNKSMMI